MFQADDLSGVHAIVPTPALPGAGLFDARGTVDLDETERLLRRLLDDGVAGIIALGTTGECATLSADDYDAFVRCIVDTVGDRVPTFIGSSALAGHEVFRRMTMLAALGCTGTLLGPPMWQPVTDAMAIDFYRQLGELVPELAIMVYANERVFRYGFGEDFWRGVTASCRTVVAAKYLRPRHLDTLLDIVGRRVKLLPSDMTVADFYQVSPRTTTACWSTAACMGPQPVLRLMDAVRRGDAAAIAAQAEAIAWSNEPLLAIIRDGDTFASHNIQIEKVRMERTGYCRPGPIRPPYGHMPPEILDAAQECGRRWLALQ